MPDSPGDFEREDNKKGKSVYDLTVSSGVNKN